MRDKQIAAERSNQTAMRIKILSTFKNEDDLLKPWIKYHARLVGAKNLILFDDGSTSKKTLHTIDWAKSQGVSIETTMSTGYHFTERGDLFRDIINEEMYKHRGDFYLPIDCDEFLAVRDTSNERRGVLLSRPALKEELRKYKASKYPLAIYAGLDNNPNHPGHFLWSEGQVKTFFTAGNCYWLDEGFHCGLSKNGEKPIKTNIVYIHYHYKPYNILIDHSKAKLEPYISDFSRPAIQDYIAQQRPAFHCATHLLRTEAEYYTMFGLLGYDRFPEIEEAFHRIGEDVPFSRRDGTAPEGETEPVPDKSRSITDQLWQWLKSVGHRA